MRSYIICFLLMVLMPFLSLSAQEVLKPLSYNTAYLKHTPVTKASKNAKSVQDPCTFGVKALKISTIIQEPDCGEANGSITVTANIFSEFYDYTLVGIDNDVSLSGTASESPFVIPDIETGAYILTVFDDLGSSVQENTYVSAGREVSFSPGDFALFPESCASGAIEKLVNLQISTQAPTVFDATDGSQVGTFSFAGRDTLFLPVGEYYVKRNGTVNPDCVAYFGFEIEIEPTVEVEFFDDFSFYASITPDNRKWMDDRAFINATFPLNPPTIGVATLDGLDQFGQPYQDDGEPLSEKADLLTSAKFCGVEEAGIDTFYLSFFYQAQGLADFPNKPDTLSLQVKDSKSQWNTIWSTFNNNQPNNEGSFTFVGITLTDDFAVPPIELNTFELTDSASMVTDIYTTYPTASDTVLLSSIENLITEEDPETGVETYFVDDRTIFYDGFQFRFKNKATVSGTNDHWHIDYVRVSPNAEVLDENNIVDLSFFEPIAPILNNYSAMPFHQLDGFQDSELLQPFILQIKNNGTEAVNSVQVYADMTEICSGTIIEESIDLKVINQLLPMSITTLNTGLFQSGSKVFRPNIPDPGQDNFVVQTRYSFEDGSTLPILNNEIIQNQVFANYFAYDDGSAEKAFGLNTSGGQFAVLHRINRPDTLIGLAIHFTDIIGDLDNKQFKIQIWNKLGEDAEPVYEEGFYKRPESYLDFEAINNGFFTYAFSEKVAVEDSFYIGLEQLDSDFLNIGFDRNHTFQKTFYQYDENGNIVDSIREATHLGALDRYFNVENFWVKSIEPGAVMIRPVVGSRLLPPNELLNSDHLTLDGIGVYPNPTNGILYVKGAQENFLYEVYNSLGQNVLQGEFRHQAIDISALPSGTYLVRIMDQNGNAASSKVLKY